jgi:hypothetical protein
VTALAPAARAFVDTRLGGLPRAFWFLWTGTLVNRLGTMVLPFLALYLTDERGISVTTAASCSPSSVWDRCSRSSSAAAWPTGSAAGPR